MANKCKILIFFLCFLVIFPFQTLQQRNNIKGTSATEKEAKNQEGTHWKSIAIIVVGVLILGAICYGTNCLFLCQMTVCKGTGRHYTKMDLTSQV